MDRKGGRRGREGSHCAVRKRGALLLSFFSFFARGLRVLLSRGARGREVDLEKGPLIRHLYYVQVLKRFFSSLTPLKKMGKGGHAVKLMTSSSRDGECAFVSSRRCRRGQLVPKPDPLPWTRGGRGGGDCQSLPRKWTPDYPTEFAPPRSVGEKVF